MRTSRRGSPFRGCRERKKVGPLTRQEHPAMAVRVRGKATARPKKPKAPPWGSLSGGSRFESFQRPLVSLAADKETLHVVCQFAAGAVFLVSPPSRCVETTAFGLASQEKVSMRARNGCLNVRMPGEVATAAVRSCATARQSAAARSAAPQVATLESVRPTRGPGVPVIAMMRRLAVSGRSASRTAAKEPVSRSISATGSHPRTVTP
jgi:hypothetical protein